MPRVKGDDRFVMRLSGPKDEMLALVRTLLAHELRADIKITTTNTRARIVAKVPQEHARKAMALAGLP